MLPLLSKGPTDRVFRVSQAPTAACPQQSSKPLTPTPPACTCLEVYLLGGFLLELFNLLLEHLIGLRKSYHLLFIKLQRLQKKGGKDKVRGPNFPWPA